MWIRVPPEGPAAGDPVVGLELLKAHLRVDYDDEDALFDAYLAAAVEHAETVLRRPVVPGTYEMVRGAFPARGQSIDLSHPPDAALELEHVRYVDPAGELQDMAADDVRLLGDWDPAIVMPRYGLSWPAARRDIGAVRIRFSAEYSEARPMPMGITRFLLAWVAHQAEHREETPPVALDTALWPHRLLRFE